MHIMPGVPTIAALASWMTLASILKSALAADPSHLVQGLPGQPQVGFKQYAGQITVNSSADRALFYWFHEANHPNSSSLPLALWLSGGPGCSSVGAGALMEIGPFRVNSTGTGLIQNPHTWNRAANLIFLESPHGVGFSYSKLQSDELEYNDDQTSSDTVQFLLEWFKKFPEYSNNDFYLLGESYAGHYVPILASRILEQNSNKGPSNINLKGFAIGNAWTDAYHDNRGNTEFYYTHSMIAEGTYNEIMNNCDFANLVPVDAGSKNSKCIAATDILDAQLQHINQYNVYMPVCDLRADSKRLKFLHPEMLAAAYDPCADHVAQYLNLPEVHAALNVVTKPERWSLCNKDANSHYLWSDVIASMLPLYRQLLTKKLNIWIYSGDIDGVVSTLSTKNWLKELNLTIETPWYAWDYKTQVGGWAEAYSALTFVTVRGAGHMVPADKPEQALAMFEHFLKHEPLPKI